MAKVKPRLFVGSSAEGRTVAEDFADALSDVAVVTPWWLSKDFRATHSVLAGLALACKSYDFGLFILTPDDKLQSRGKKTMSARDNVLFELGLFLGALGANRTFAALQEAESSRKAVKVPSDLAGIVIPRFACGDRDAVLASIRMAANSLRPIIRRESRRRERLELIKDWAYNDATKVFTMTLARDGLELNRAELLDKAFALVAVLENDAVSFEDDTAIALSAARQLSIKPGDLVLRADGAGILGNVRPGQKITGYLLLLPAGHGIAKKKTISQMLNDGCELLADRSLAGTED